MNINRFWKVYDIGEEKNTISYKPSEKWIFGYFYDLNMLASCTEFVLP